MRLSSAAEQLNKEVAAGNYLLADLSDCGIQVAGDRYPQLVRFQEFTLFADPNPRFGERPQLLVFQPQALLSARDATRLKTRFRDEVIASGVAAIATESSGSNTGRRDTVRSTAPSKGRSAFDGNVALDDLVSSLGNLTGMEFHLPVTGRPLRPSDVGDLVNEVMWPGPYQPPDAVHPVVAICATYEQTWQALGHTRGELISSLGLAPGERVTLELHSWDKSSRKTEEELATESEMRTAEKLTQRDALTVAQEYSKQVNSKVDASATVPIPKMPVSVSGSVATEVRQALNSTKESIREKTVEASSSLKLNRKSRVEVSREVGREEKQSRVIENTNRCHTLNCHYFELIANYRVTTRLVSVRPCLLVRNPRPTFTLDWILCHEDILVESLLDRLFLQGFAAAKTLKTSRTILSLQTAAAQAEAENLNQRLLPVINSVLTSFRQLRDAYQAATTIVQDCGKGNLLCLMRRVPLSVQDRLVGWFSLQDSQRSALERLEQAIAGGQAAGEAASAFLNVLGPQQLEEPRSETAVEQALREFYGFGSVNLKKEVTAYDDAGLRGAVDALSAAATSAAQSAEESPQPNMPSLTELADAQVEFERLQCHLTDNWLHYSQAVWAREGRDQRFLRLQNLGGLANLIENELLGFYADRAAYPLRRTDGLAEVDVDRIVREASADIEAQVDEPTLVAMPTPGLLLEAAIGECDACEDYIQQSRVLDLRQQEARSRQEEAEAQRRELRLAANPPDLSEPVIDKEPAVRLIIEREEQPPP